MMRLTKVPYVINLIPYFLHASAIPYRGRWSMSEYCTWFDTIPTPPRVFLRCSHTSIVVLVSKLQSPTALKRPGLSFDI